MSGSRAKSGKNKFRKGQRRKIRHALKNSDITQLGNTAPYKIGWGIGIETKHLRERAIDRYAFDVV